MANKTLTERLRELAAFLRLQKRPLAVKLVNETIRELRRLRSELRATAKEQPK